MANDPANPEALVDLPLGPVEADDPNPAIEARAADIPAIEAPAAEADEPAPAESKREAIARGIRERRAKETGLDDTPEEFGFKTDVVPGLEGAAVEAAPEPGPEAAPTVAKRKFKVDGQEVELSDEDVARIVQMNLAADRRLEDAKRDREAAARERAEAVRLLENANRGEPAYQPAPAPSAEAADPEPDLGKLKELRERILFGDETDGAQALDEYQRMLKGTPQTREDPDIRSMVAEALAERQRQEATSRALTTFAEKNPDLVNDRKARLLVEDGLIEEMQRDMLAFPDVREEDVKILTPMQVAAAHRELRERGFQVRHADALMEAAAESARAFRGQTPAPREPEARPMSSREDLKRALPGQPRSAGIRVELGSAPQPRSRSDVISEMRNRTQGRPASPRH